LVTKKSKGPSAEKKNYYTGACDFSLPNLSHGRTIETGSVFWMDEKLSGNQRCLRMVNKKMSIVILKSKHDVDAIPLKENSGTQKVN
jgi:hypothetical protein